jgi:hypothetical protein
MTHPFEGQIEWDIRDSVPDSAPFHRTVDADRPRVGWHLRTGNVIPSGGRPDLGASVLCDVHVVR